MLSSVCGRAIAIMTQPWTRPEDTHGVRHGEDRVSMREIFGKEGVSENRGLTG